MPVIQATSLVKKYGSLVALDGVDFAVEPGECFGFLGPNGAGKSTIMKLISCTSPLTSGELLVEGMNVKSQARSVKSILGVVSQEENLDPDLTVLQNLLAYARYYDLSRDLARHRALEALERFELIDRRNSRIDELSGGMKKRLLVARALLHQPKALILDEPTTGLDPQARQLLWQNIKQLRHQGTTLLLTTHYMEEATYLCNRLVIMDKGKILVEGQPTQVVEQCVGAQVAEVSVGLNGKDQVLALLQDTGLSLQDLGDRIVIFRENGHLKGDLGLPPSVEVLRRPATLEDAFLQLTGRGLQDR